MGWLADMQKRKIFGKFKNLIQDSIYVPSKFKIVPHILLSPTLSWYPFFVLFYDEPCAVYFNSKSSFELSCTVLRSKTYHMYGNLIKYLTKLAMTAI